MLIRTGGKVRQGSVKTIITISIWVYLSITFVIVAPACLHTIICVHQLLTLPSLPVLFQLLMQLLGWATASDNKAKCGLMSKGFLMSELLFNLNQTIKDVQTAHFSGLIHNNKHNLRNLIYACNQHMNYVPYAIHLLMTIEPFFDLLVGKINGLKARMPVFYPSPHIAILFYCLNFHLCTALQILLNTCVRPLVLVIQFPQMFLICIFNVKSLSLLYYQLLLHIWVQSWLF